MRSVVVACVGLLLLSASAFAASGLNLYVSEMMSHCLVKGEKVVVPFSLDGDGWRMAGRNLEVKFRAAWRKVGSLTGETKIADWKGLKVHFNEFNLLTDEDDIRLRFEGSGGWIDRVRLELVAPEVKTAPLYFTFHSVSEDDPLDDEAGWITAPEDIKLIRKWIEDGCPENKKAWALVGMHDCKEHEADEHCGMVGAYVSVAVVKHSVEELKKLGKFDDLFVMHIDDLYDEGLDVEVLCSEMSLDFEPLEN